MREENNVLNPFLNQDDEGLGESEETPEEEEEEIETPEEEEDEEEI